MRVLVDVPGKLPSVANGEMQEYLLEKIYPQLPEKIQVPIPFCLITSLPFVLCSLYVSSWW